MARAAPDHPTGPPALGALDLQAAYRNAPFPDPRPQTGRLRSQPRTRRETSEHTDRHRRHRRGLLGTEPGPQRPGDPGSAAGVPLRPECRPGPPGARAVQHRAGQRRPRRGARRPGGRRPWRSPPRPPRTSTSRWRRSRPASTCWWRSRSPPTWADGAKVVQAAEDAGLVLMLDHTYCYTPAVPHLRELVRGGELGDLQYLDSVRINLGLVQRDVDVIWDLAPHDLSILDSLLPDGVSPGHRRRARFRPDRLRPGLRRPPDHRALERRDRARPRELAVADQGPDDDRRRLPSDGRLGRPQPGPAAGGLRPQRRDPRPRHAGPGRARTRPGCRTGSATWSPPRCPRRRHCAR